MGNGWARVGGKEVDERRKGGNKRRKKKGMVH